MSSTQGISQASKFIANKFFGANSIIGRPIVPSPLAGSHTMHTDIHEFGFSNDFTNWQGGSGRLHPVYELSVCDFILEDGFLYMLVAKNSAIWIGTANNLIEDSASRTRFRHASGLAIAAYRLALPDDENKKILLISDLMSGHAVSSLHVA